MTARPKALRCSMDARPKAMRSGIVAKPTKTKISDLRYLGVTALPAPIDLVLSVMLNSITLSLAVMLDLSLWFTMAKRTKDLGPGTLPNLKLFGVARY